MLKFTLSGHIILPPHFFFIENNNSYLLCLNQLSKILYHNSNIVNKYIFLDSERSDE